MDNMTIRQYKYSTTEMPMTLLCQEQCSLISKSEDFMAQISSHYIVYKQSQYKLGLINLLNMSNELSYETESQEIYQFSLLRNLHQTYIVLLLQNSVRILEIVYDQCIKTKTQINYDDNCDSAGANIFSFDDIGSIVVYHDSIRFINISDCQSTCQKLNLDILEIHHSLAYRAFFILTNNNKVYILNQTSLQILNEYSLKYTSELHNFMVLYQSTQLFLITLTDKKRLIIQKFSNQDFHTANLLPIQSLKLNQLSSQYSQAQQLAESQEAQILGLRIDMGQNLIFIPMKINLNLFVYILLMNDKLKGDQPDEENCFISLIKVIQMQNQPDPLFYSLFVPIQLQAYYLNDNQFTAEFGYRDYLNAYTSAIGQVSSVSLNDHVTYLCMSVTKEQIQFFWLYSDSIFTRDQEFQESIQLYNSKNVIQQGSKSLVNSQLPQMQDQNKIINSKSEDQRQMNVDYDDPVKKAAEIMESQLLAPINQQITQLNQVCSDVRNELYEDPTFMLGIKDLIEESIKQEIDKSQSQSHEQQIKLELQQLESQMEAVMNQNLDMFAQTCEGFITDNFNKDFFEQLIDQRVQDLIKQSTNYANCQEHTSLIYGISEQYLKNSIVPLYDREVSLLISNTNQLYDKINGYIQELSLNESIKITNFNQIIESLNSQLVKLTKSIQTLVENHKPNQENISKLDALLASFEILTKQIGKGAIQASYQIQQVQPNGSYDAIQDKLSQISQNLICLRQDLTTIHSQEQKHGQTPQGEQFIRHIASNLTQLQMRISQPNQQLQTIQEVVQSLILQFQLFVLKSDN